MFAWMQQPAPIWGFPFPNSCWKVLEMVRPDEKIDIHCLFNICRSIPVQDGLNFGHDYGGIAQWEEDPENVSHGEECKLALKPDLAYFRRDPLGEVMFLRGFFRKIHREGPLDFHTQSIGRNPEHYAEPGEYEERTGPSLPPGEGLKLALDSNFQRLRSNQQSLTSIQHIQQWRRSGRSGRGTSKGTPAYSYRMATGADIFSRLPLDILQYILEDLPIVAIFHLRQASKSCGKVPLAEIFWKSRFYSDPEFECIFKARELAVSLMRKWVTLHDLGTSLRTDPDLANRKRIWRLVHSI